MNVEYRGRAAFLPDADALVLADLHVGRVAASNVDAPLPEGDDLVERLSGHLDAFDPTTVVFAGDVLHVHGSIPTNARVVLETLLDAVRGADAEPVLVRGNHDSLLDSIGLGDGVPVVDEYELGDETVVCHGHEEPDAEAPRYVVGHDHPAIRVEGARHPCFLRGDGVYDGGDVLALPAFNRAAPGTLVDDRRGLLSPLLADLGSFRPVVVGTEAYEFPPLESFADLL